MVLCINLKKQINNNNINSTTSHAVVSDNKKSVDMRGINLQITEKIVTRGD